MVESTIAGRVADRLRLLRTSAGLTQAELGERAGIAPAELSKFENARRTPTLETLERLADALRVRTSELLDPAQALEEIDPEVAVLVQRLRGQTPEVLRRAIAVVDALIRVG